MSAKSSKIAAAFALAFASLLPAVSVAQRSAPAGTATITVTAMSKKGVPPAVNQADVQLMQGKERKQIARWAKAEKLSLAILIDESLDSEVASQWGEVKQFIEALPPRVDAVCPIGAGDALAAAFTWAMAKGSTFEDAVRWGVAAGTASAQLPGVSFATLQQTEQVYKLVEMRAA